MPHSSSWLSVHRAVQCFTGKWSGISFPEIMWLCQKWPKKKRVKFNDLFAAWLVCFMSPLLARLSWNFVIMSKEARGKRFKFTYFSAAWFKSAWSLFSLALAFWNFVIMSNGQAAHTSRSTSWMPCRSCWCRWVWGHLWHCGSCPSSAAGPQAGGAQRHKETTLYMKLRVD